jgi:hypothetical protein
MPLIEQTDFLEKGRTRLAQRLATALTKRGVSEIDAAKIEEALREVLTDAFPELQAIDELRAADMPEIDWPKRPAWPGASPIMSAATMWMSL